MIKVIWPQITVYFILSTNYRFTLIVWVMEEVIWTDNLDSIQYYQSNPVLTNIQHIVINFFKFFSM